MRGSDSATKIKSSSMLGAVPPAFIHHPKRSKPKLLNTNINDLPDNLLVEILCRSQDRYELVREYKLVCKRWCNLTSDPYYVRRFLCYKVRREETQQPEPRLALISKEREQFDAATPYWSSSSDLLAPVFERLMRANLLDREPDVVATYNDLVLCCVTKYVQRDYFICNPHTMQWAALPSPPSRTLYNVPVGFICDSPFYYFCEEEKDKHGNILEEQLVNVNADYSCRVVRVLPYGDAESRSQCFTQEKSFKFNVEIFSFETGKWSESVISSPRKFNFKEINPDINFAYNGMLYWSSKSSNANFLIGLDPFVINNVDTKKNSACGGDRYDGDIDDSSYKCRFIELIVPTCIEVPYTPIQGVSGGVQGECLRLCSMDNEKGMLVWEFKEEDDVIISADGAGTLIAKYVGGEYTLTGLAYEAELESLELIALDPNEEDILYLRAPVDRGVVYQVADEQIFIFQADLRGKKTYLWRLTARESKGDSCFFPLNVLPWWPTPVPIVPTPIKDELLICSCNNPS